MRHHALVMIVIVIVNMVSVLVRMVMLVACVFVWIDQRTLHRVWVLDVLRHNQRASGGMVRCQGRISIFNLPAAAVGVDHSSHRHQWGGGGSVGVGAYHTVPCTKPHLRAP
jgi:hypothetical protein